MKLTTTIALGAVLATAAAPALASEWVYHGGPKSPDSLTWVEPDGSYYGYGPAPYATYGDEAGPYVAGPYGAGPYGPPPGYDWYAPRAYRCDPATVDCYNRSRQFQGTR